MKTCSENVCIYLYFILSKMWYNFERQRTIFPFRSLPMPIIIILVFLYLHLLLPYFYLHFKWYTMYSFFSKGYSIFSLLLLKCYFQMSSIVGIKKACVYEATCKSQQQWNMGQINLTLLPPTLHLYLRLNQGSTELSHKPFPKILFWNKS